MSYSLRLFLHAAGCIAVTCLVAAQRITLGAPELVKKPVGMTSLEWDQLPDGPMPATSNGPGEYLLFFTNGHSFRARVTDLGSQVWLPNGCGNDDWILEPADNPTNACPTVGTPLFSVPGIQGLDDKGSWLYSIYRKPGSSTDMFGFYHAETHYYAGVFYPNNYWAEQYYCTSSDNGKTWVRGGKVLSPQESKPTVPVVVAGGAKNAITVLPEDQGFAAMAMFFQESTQNVQEYPVLAISHDSEGLPGTWLKYNDGVFEPESSSWEADPPAGLEAIHGRMVSLSWNTYLQKYVAIGTAYQFPSRFWLATSADLLSWSRPVLVVDDIPVGEQAVYPILLDQTAQYGISNRYSDSQAWLYYGVKEDPSKPWKDTFYRRTISFHREPISAFTATKPKGMSPLAVTFQDQSSNGVISWDWDFDGDGVIDSHEQGPTHVYLENGTYSPSLTVRNVYGDSDTHIASQWIVVGVPEPGFMASSATGSWPLTVAFTFNGRYDPADLVSLAWDFDNDGLDDDTTSLNPSFTYTAPGVYSVSLTMTSSFGSATVLRKDLIAVAGQVTPVARASVIPTGGAAPLTVHLKDLSSNAPTQWQWFVDGAPAATGEAPSLVLSSSGTHFVTVVSSNAYGVSAPSPPIGVDVVDTPQVMPVNNSVANYNPGGGAWATGWNYQERISAGVYSDMSWDGTMWIGSPDAITGITNARIASWFQDSGDRESALVWKSPRDGVVHITTPSGKPIARHPASAGKYGDGFSARLMHDGRCVWGPQLFPYENSPSVGIDVTLVVKEGDCVRLLHDRLFADTKDKAQCQLDVALDWGPFGVDGDGDGLSDKHEMWAGTDAQNADSDSDGLWDYDELELGTDPLLPDSDGDGVLDGLEVGTYGSNPFVVDTDGDGLSDGLEITIGSDPTVSDSDGDLVPDGEEYLAATTSPLVADTDADGLSDYAELYRTRSNPLIPDTDGDGLLDGVEDSSCSDILVFDTDGDSIGDGAEIGAGTDPCDDDSDDDFLTDGEESVLGTDPLMRDSDGDKFWDVMEDYLETSPLDAMSFPVDLDGTGLAQLDINGDAAFSGNGIPDGDEWALLCTYLNDVSLGNNGAVVASWAGNASQLYDDWAASAAPTPSSRDFLVSVANMTLGDYDGGAVPMQGAVAATVSYLNTLGINVDPANYFFSGAPYLAVDGDGDGDGVSNADEYVLAGMVRSSYLLRVLDPSLPVQKVLLFGEASVSCDWNTIAYSEDVWFVDPVVVCTINYSSNAGANNEVPMVARVQNAGPRGFDCRLQSPGDVSTLIGTQRVYYVACERGSWTLEDGRLIEAEKYISTRTDRKGMWQGSSRSYAHLYTDPVVVGQVMTCNDAAWSAFWSCGPQVFQGKTSRAKNNQPADSGTLWTGKHVADDPSYQRSDEVVGYVVLEEGAGSVGGVSYAAFSGDWNSGPSDYFLRGIDNGPPFSRMTTGGIALGVASAGTMVGDDGAWAYFYGQTPFGGSQIQFSADETLIVDGERSHPKETVSFLGASGAGYLKLKLP